MKKNALILIVLTMFSKILGFIREIILSYFYGVSNISDAYLISLTIPGTIFVFIGTGIATSYIPMYSSIVKKSCIKSADKFTNNIINSILIICALITIMTLVFTVPIVRLFASGFNGETLSLAISFTRISIFGIFFLGLIYVFSAYLQLKTNFIVPALMGIPFNFFIIVSIVWSTKFNTIILSIGSVIAIASQLLLLIPFVYKKGFRYRLVFERHDEHLRKMMFLSLPVIIGVSVNQINILVDRTIASKIAMGGISALTYANRLNLFIQGIFVVSIITVMYPLISRMAAENNLSGLKKSLAKVINAINLLVIPITVGSMFFSKPIVKFLFGRGAFDSQAIAMTSNALFFYSIGMVGFGLRETISRVFYSLQDTKTPMINAAISIVINIVLNIILSKFLGIGGLALATSISAIFCTILLFVSLRKKMDSYGVKKISISFIKIVIASITMGGLCRFTYGILINNISLNLSLVISIGLGAIVYSIMIYFMKIEDVDVIVLIIKKKFRCNYNKHYVE